MEKLVKRKVTDPSLDPHENETSSVWSKEILEALFSFGIEQFIFAKGKSWPPKECGFLDLYSGKKGFAKACVQLGAPWVLTVDFLDGPQCDLLDSTVRSRIWFLLKSGVFLHVSAAPICASFSTAITPPVRSVLEPKGILPIRETMIQKIFEGNCHSEWLAALIRFCILTGLHYWVENPDGSFLWKQPEWLDLPKGAAKRFYRVDYCSFNAPWRKRTRFLTSGRLRDTKRFCTRDHSHTVLRGRSKKHKMSMTKLAEAYPRRLCYILAWAACSDVGLLKLNCNQSVGHDHRRIGEAKNPGPNRPRRDRDPLLDSVEMVRPQTLDIGRKAWDDFVAWIKDNMGSDLFRSLWLVPGLMGAMLGHYGRHVYECGQSLFSFRHLVVYAQRMYPGFRGHLQPAWNLINRWEELEPVNHRRPLPVKMVQAMVCLALAWEWIRVGAVILISFFGCCRPGEVLGALRGHLVLPCDLGQSDGPCFLRICKPKPGRRGMGRVQHSKILDQNVVRFLENLFGQRRANEKIYSGSPSAFRTRWNKLLLALGIPKDFELTPAGLRAGGTVHLYRSGTPILDILWALRLKNVETLQHYLQEISTQITMVDLPPAAKSNVIIFAEMYPFFLSTSKR